MSGLKHVAGVLLDLPEQCFIVAKVFCGFKGVLVVFFVYCGYLASVFSATPLLLLRCCVVLLWYCSAGAFPSVSVNCCGAARGFHMVAKLLDFCGWGVARAVLYGCQGVLRVFRSLQCAYYDLTMWLLRLCVFSCSVK